MLVSFLAFNGLISEDIIIPAMMVNCHVLATSQEGAYATA